MDWKTIILIAAITWTAIAVIVVIAACIVSGRCSEAERRQGKRVDD